MTLYFSIWRGLLPFKYLLCLSTITINNNNSNNYNDINNNYDFITVFVLKGGSSSVKICINIKKW